ncbi:hypothetical protein NMY22_g1195 [Coprinellus aureogranulatus]|nr:hypothetical protein NMY22_g1195 [Coprinellus aureogranulatus]
MATQSTAPTRRSSRFASESASDSGSATATESDLDNLPDKVPPAKKPRQGYNIAVASPFGKKDTPKQTRKPARKSIASLSGVVSSLAPVAERPEPEDDQGMESQTSQQMKKNKKGKEKEKDAAEETEPEQTSLSEAEAAACLTAPAGLESDSDHPMEVAIRGGSTSKGRATKTGRNKVAGKAAQEVLLALEEEEEKKKKKKKKEAAVVEVEVVEVEVVVVDEACQVGVAVEEEEAFQGCSRNGGSGGRDPSNDGHDDHEDDEGKHQESVSENLRCGLAWSPPGPDSGLTGQGLPCSPLVRERGETAPGTGFPAAEICSSPPGLQHSS